MFGWLFGHSQPEPEPVVLRKFRQKLTVYLTDGTAIDKVIEAEDEDYGMLVQPGSETLAEIRHSFLDRVGQSGFQVGATFIPAWRIDRVEIGCMEDVE